MQVYLAPVEPGTDRPARALAGFAGIEAAPGESAEAVVELPQRAFEVWDTEADAWAFVKGLYEVQAGRSLLDPRLSTIIEA
ncbi:fibronectin type III-like domain-contianing protein [Streptomyces sp. NPDC001914]|uniref:fibronectin type III-like domain-contianing protein n=1 Tax=Streptomyces sp. NPDC001914 TaxID=3364623 RepID=UPI003684A898